MSIVQEYKGHTEAVESCIFLTNTDQQLIATSSRDATVRVWDQNTKGIHNLLHVNFNPVSAEFLKWTCPALHLEESIA